MERVAILEGGLQRVRSGAKPQTYAEITEEASRDAQVVWLHAAAAAGVVLVFGVWHCCSSPYKWDFQNTMDTSLFVADFLVIGLGAVHRHHRRRQHGQRRRRGRRWRRRRGRRR